MTARNRLLFFFVVTGSGSVLSALATFIRMEWVFQDMQLLGLALSVKTVGALFVSRLAAPYLSKVGTRRSLTHSQWFGLLSLTILYFGFSLKILPLVLLGIGLSSIPMVLVNVGVIAQGRILSQGEGHFRSFSARIQGALGGYFLAASLAAPVLLKFFGIEVVFAIDAISYGLGLWVLSGVSDSPHLAVKEECALPRGNWIHALFSSRQFLLFAGAPLLLSAFAPLLASSKSISLTDQFPAILRESLWSVEAITILLSGLLYGFAHRWLESRLVQAGLMLSAAALTPLLLSPTPIVVGSVLLFNAFVFNTAYLKGRDDLIVGVGLSESQIKSRSSLAFGYKSLVQALSPLILTWLFSSVSVTQAVWVLLGTQATCLILWCFCFEVNRERVHDSLLLKVSTK